MAMTQVINGVDSCQSALTLPGNVKTKPSGRRSHDHDHDQDHDGK